jgi:hypothetical protein
MKYRKKPVEIEATQWFKNGDHPLDYASEQTGYQNEKLSTISAYYRKAHNWEGAVVRYFRHPAEAVAHPAEAFAGERKCEKCGTITHLHGWIDTLEGGHIVCPGDWIITGVKGEHYPCKPDIFSMTYEPVEAGKGGE